MSASATYLCCQHGSVRGRLVTVRLNLHAAGNTADGFTATGITQNISLCTILLGRSALPAGWRDFWAERTAAVDSRRRAECVDEPEIGNMDESVVEGCEDTSDTEDEFA